MDRAARGIPAKMRFIDRKWPWAAEKAKGLGSENRATDQISIV
jgi:hypothetical protein